MLNSLEMFILFIVFSLGNYSQSVFLSVDTLVVRLDSIKVTMEGSLFFVICSTIGGCTIFYSVIFIVVLFSLGTFYYKKLNKFSFIFGFTLDFLLLLIVCLVIVFLIKTISFKLKYKRFYLAGFWFIVFYTKIYL